MPKCPSAKIPLFNTLVKLHLYHTFDLTSSGLVPVSFLVLEQSDQKQSDRYRLEESRYQATQLFVHWFGRDERSKIVCFWRFSNVFLKVKTTSHDKHYLRQYAPYICNRYTLQNSEAVRSKLRHLELKTFGHYIREQSLYYFLHLKHVFIKNYP